MAIQPMNCDNTVWERLLDPGHFFDSSGHDILYFGSAAVIECFQPMLGFVRPSANLRADSASALDLGQTQDSKYW